MRILLVTGRLASSQARRLARRAPKNIRVDVLVLDLPVAAMMTAEYVASKLRERGVRGYDLILVPGLMRGDASIVSEAVGVRVWKGPRSIGDLPAVLEAIAEGYTLSPEKPADNVVSEQLFESMKRRLEEAEAKCMGLNIGSLCVPIRPPPLRIAAELPPSLSEERLVSEAERLATLGADIVVVGLGSEHGPEDAYRRVRITAEAANKPVAIDSGKPECLAAGIDAGASMALSMHKGFAEKLEGYGDKAVFVVVPSAGRGVPKTPQRRLRLLSEVLEEAANHGFRQLIIDPVLLPPMQGLAESLEAYARASRKFRDLPIMMGIANVTELMDADSIGVNAVLTSIAAEMGVSVLLVTEDSWKARGSVAETRIASAMASSALILGSPPKDLGIDLLVVKEKRPRSMAEEWGKPSRLLEIHEPLEAERLDPRGYVKIRLTGDLIEACLYKYGSTRPELCVRGRHGLSLVRALCREAGIRDPDHISYLAYEAAKAEIALALEKSYVQEEPLFTPVKLRLRRLGDLAGGGRQASRRHVSSD